MAGARAPDIVLNEVFEGDGDVLFAHACKHPIWGHFTLCGRNIRRDREVRGRAKWGE
jgi:hypothetical protein